MEVIYSIMATPIKHLSIEEVESIFTDAGMQAFRGQQVLSWLYKNPVASYDEMSNIPKVIREQFDLAFPLAVPEIVDKRVSRDSSRKYVVKFDDGAIAETVALLSRDGDLSVCVSSQAGCGMKCAFCATGQTGLTRNLFPGEIADQVTLVQQDMEMEAKRVVVMGQGEPFANYDNVLAALRIINHPKLLQIGARHITVSTCGVIPGIERFSREPEQFTLAISLHSAVQETRDNLMPAMKSYPLNVLRRTLNTYAERTGRRFTFEYALMEGINDSPEDLEALVQYCRGLLCHVNLIPLNEVPGSPFKPVKRFTLDSWCEKLERAGVAATVRNSRGSDIAGACGQLAAQQKL